MALIGLSGKIKSGKNTVATLINELTMDIFEEKAFAKKLKEFVASITGCDVKNLEDQNFKLQQLPPEWQDELQTRTFRWLLQVIGTDALRNNVHENIWVNALFADYLPKYHGGIDPAVGSTTPSDVQVFVGHPKWIITDMRFPNELDAIKKRGGITIRINRPKEKVDVGNDTLNHVLNETKNFGIQEHPSETALDNAEFDYVIENNSTIEELKEKVKDILIKEKIILG